jgi:hypothetical protein
MKRLKIFLLQEDNKLTVSIIKKNPPDIENQADLFYWQFMKSAAFFISESTFLSSEAGIASVL